MEYLVLMEVGKKQSYIFKSNKLKENIGASMIIQYVTEELPNNKISEFNGKEIMRGGGKSLFSFNNEVGAFPNISDSCSNSGNDIRRKGCFDWGIADAFTKDFDFNNYVYDGKNTTTKTIKVEFVNPFYCGLASGTLQEIVQKKGDYTYNNITCNNDSIVFKYPKSYGTLTSILDSNNFENISAFSRNEEVINSVDYYVYTSAVTTVTNFKFIFKF